ncbi:MAG: PQQ-binding-like beta-propeller repeat protein [Acidobacteriota bacterium]|nr:PQQ-binding-like beta-propeller repeat protein [Acidobacteriota bacterium]
MFLKLLLPCVTALTFAGDWSTFRGPDSSGLVKEDLPYSWDVASGKNIRWKVTVPGLSHSSPIVVGDRIYLTTAVNTNPEDFDPAHGGIGLSKPEGDYTWKLLCLDRKSGKTIWEQTAHRGKPATARHIKSSQNNVTPASDGKYVLAIFDSEGLFCFDADGKQLWKVDLGKLTAGFHQDKTQAWGHASSPVIYKNLAIVQVDRHENSYIAAYNLKDGSRAWKVDRDELPSWSTPALYRGKRTELVTNGVNYIRAYNPANGKELWRFKNYALVKTPTPVVFGEHVLVSGGYPQGQPIKALPLGRDGELSDSDVIWSTEQGGPYTVTPVAVDGRVYSCTDHGILSAYDQKTGKRLFRERLGGGFSGSLVAVPGKVFASSQEGDVYVIEPGDQYKLLAKMEMGETIMSTPAIAHGTLFLRTRGHLYAIGK